jgi:hypothetical protein
MKGPLLIGTGGEKRELKRFNMEQLDLSASLASTGK